MARATTLSQVETTNGVLVVRRSRWATAIGAVLVLVVMLGVMAWYATSPDPLPTSDRTVPASTSVGQPIYVGVFRGGSGFDRTLSLSGVKVHTTSSTELTVTPLLCRDGAVGVTSDPQAFCTELVNPEGERLTPNDSIVLEVTSNEPAVAVIDPVRLAFREHLQWATLPAGSGAIVRVLAG